jgi:hypothetical protein
MGEKESLTLEMRRELATFLREFRSCLGAALLHGVSYGEGCSSWSLDMGVGTMLRSGVRLCTAWSAAWCDAAAAAAERDSGVMDAAFWLRALDCDAALCPDGWDEERTLSEAARLTSAWVLMTKGWAEEVKSGGVACDTRKAAEYAAAGFFLALGTSFSVAATRWVRDGCDFEAEMNFRFPPIDAAALYVKIFGVEVFCPCIS